MGFGGAVAVLGEADQRGFVPVGAKSAAPTFTYYVDSAAGVDANPGTLAQPWKTVGHVNGISLTPGQSVGFKRGGVWREDLVPAGTGGSSASPVLYGAYGAGALPIITASDLITAGWTRNTANVWQASVATQPHIVYFSGARGIPVAALANITTTFDWWWSAGVLYVWSPSDTDPSTYYTAPGIEAGSRARACETNNASYVTFDSLNFRDGNALADTTVNVGSTSVVGVKFSNCVIERGISNGIELKGSTTATSFTIDHCTVRNNGAWGVLVDYLYTSGAISNGSVTGNGFQSVVDAQQYAGIQGTLGNITISGNTIDSNCAVCATAGQCHGIYVLANAAVATIQNNTISNTATGDGIKTRGSASITGNAITGNAYAGVEVGGNAAVNITVSVDHNVVYNNGSSNASSGIVEQAKGTGTIALSVTNNSTYQNANTSQLELNVTDNIASLTVKDNIFYVNLNRRTIGLVTQAAATVDYNDTFAVPPTSPIYNNYNGSGQTFAQWQALGFDAHGKQADPLYNNPGAGDFTLRAGSPCIGASSTGGNMGAK